MTCAGIVERLYDEDVRAALAAGGPPPADLRSHLGDCADCRAEWDAAREDALQWRAGLEEAPPPHLTAAIARTWTVPRGALHAIDWAAALSCGGAAGAVAVAGLRLLTSAPPLPWAAAAFALAAACAFAVQVTAAALSDASCGRA